VFEALIDSFEALVNALEALIDSFEALVDAILEAVEAGFDAGEVGAANELGPVVGRHRFEYGIGGFGLQVVGDQPGPEGLAGFWGERHGVSRALGMATAVEPGGEVETDHT
jgi:hypothetical protein